MSKIKIGKVRYNKEEIIIPTYEDYETILITKNSEYEELNSFYLKNDKGMLIGNVWEFSKLYSRVSDSQQKVSRNDSRIIWRWKDDIFVENNQILPDYWIWRDKGMNSSDLIHHPVGFNGRLNCIGAIKTYDIFDEKKDLNDFEILDYIEARKLIYYPLYAEAVKKQDKYKILQNKLNQGKNLLICDVDVVYQDSLDYYKKTYEVNDDFIKDWTMEVNKENMNIMINDEKHSFSHAYCLGMTLLDISID